MSHRSPPYVDIEGKFVRAFIENIDHHNIAECISMAFVSPHIFVAEVPKDLSLKVKG